MRHFEKPLIRPKPSNIDRKEEFSLAASLTFPSRWSVRVSLTAIILKEELAPTATAAVQPRSTVCVVGAMMLVGSTCPPVVRAPSLWQRGFSCHW